LFAQNVFGVPLPVRGLDKNRKYKKDKRYEKQTKHEPHIHVFANTQYCCHCQPVFRISAFFI
jgi:hypothetical protein